MNGEGRLTLRYWRWGRLWTLSTFQGSRIRCRYDRSPSTNDGHNSLYTVRTTVPIRPLGPFWKTSSGWSPLEGSTGVHLRTFQWSVFPFVSGKHLRSLGFEDHVEETCQVPWSHERKRTSSDLDPPSSPSNSVFVVSVSGSSNVLWCFIHTGNTQCRYFLKWQFNYS